MADIRCVVNDYYGNSILLRLPRTFNEQCKLCKKKFKKNNNPSLAAVSDSVNKCSKLNHGGY